MLDKNLNDAFHISALLLKKINDSLTISEAKELDEWALLNEKNLDILKRLSDERIRNKDVGSINSFNPDNSLGKVQKRIIEHNKRKARPKAIFQHIAKISIAATILVIFSIAVRHYESRVSVATVNHTLAKNTVQPGGKVAILILSNGRRIDLRTAGNGIIAQQGNFTVDKTTDGRLRYEASESDNSNRQLEYNTLFVPRGGEYQITLPDGTKVWLNAETSLKYPVVFSKTDRKVELAGEAYFEVSHDANRPFKVVSNSQVLEVLGTHFNVESYPGEQKQITTLFQGSVKVNKGPVFSIIKPGQMVVNDRSVSQLSILPANNEEALAWKNGYFNFNNDDIEDIMKRISRWYNVDVEYRGTLKERQYWGTFSKSKSLSSLLNNLEETKTIHFKIEGRRIIVMP
ncbi:MAG TPA: FecR domain-containing protein [Mucilaginibacter sp.]|nr:FecR domain-containing protein [Mucilaginibacter sp.]